MTDSGGPEALILVVMGVGAAARPHYRGVRDTTATLMSFRGAAGLNDKLQAATEFHLKPIPRARAYVIAEYAPSSPDPRMWRS